MSALNSLADEPSTLAQVSSKLCATNECKPACNDLANDIVTQLDDMKKTTAKILEDKKAYVKDVRETYLKIVKEFAEKNEAMKAAKDRLDNAKVNVGSCTTEESQRVFRCYN
jgi:hypothetical protein